MLKTLFRRRSRAFTVASLLTVLVALLHGLGLAGEPPNEEWSQALEAMHETSVAAGAFEFTLYTVLESVWIQVSALLVLLAATNLAIVLAAPEAARPAVIRSVSALHAVFYALLALFFGFYRIPPPLISFAVLAVVYGVGWWTAGAKPARTHRETEGSEEGARGPAPTKTTS